MNEQITFLKNWKVTEGSIAVNEAIVLARGENVALIHVDLKAKHAFVAYTADDDGVPSVAIHYTSSTIKHNENSNEATVISFDGFEGWSVDSALVSRYTLHVTLVNYHNLISIPDE